MLVHTLAAGGLAGAGSEGEERGEGGSEGVERGAEGKEGAAEKEGAGCRQSTGRTWSELATRALFGIEKLSTTTNRPK